MSGAGAARPSLTWLLSSDFRSGRRAARELAAQAPGDLPAEKASPWREANAARLVGRGVGYGLFGLAALDVATIAFVLVAPIHWYVGFAITKSAALGGGFLAAAASAGRARREIEAAATLEAVWGNSGSSGSADGSDGSAETAAGDASAASKTWTALPDADKEALRNWAETRLNPPAEGSTLLEKVSRRYAQLVTKTEQDADQLH